MRRRYVILFLVCAPFAHGQSLCPSPGNTGTTDGGLVSYSCAPANIITTTVGTCASGSLNCFANSPLTELPGANQPWMDFYYNTADGIHNTNPTVIIYHSGANETMADGGLPAGEIDLSDGLVATNGKAPSIIYSMVDGSFWTGTPMAGKHVNVVAASFSLFGYAGLTSAVSAGATSLPITTRQNCTYFWPSQPPYSIWIGTENHVVTAQSGNWGCSGGGNGHYTLTLQSPGLANSYAAQTVLWPMGNEGADGPTSPCQASLKPVADFGRLISYLTANVGTIPGNGHYMLFGFSGAGDTFSKVPYVWKTMQNEPSPCGTPNADQNGVIDRVFLLSPDTDYGAEAVEASIYPHQVAPCAVVSSWGPTYKGVMWLSGPGINNYNGGVASVTSISPEGYAFGGLTNGGANSNFTWVQGTSAVGLRTGNGIIAPNADGYVPLFRLDGGENDESNLCATQVNFGETTPGTTYNIQAGQAHGGDLYTATGRCKNNSASEACYDSITAGDLRTFFGNEATPSNASLSSPVTFPNTLSRTTSSALAATLSNTGTATLNNIVPTITGANPSDFALSTGTNACGATLAAGSSCMIYVTFTPASASSFTATLSVADSASGSPQTSTLTGTGTAGGPTTWPNGYTYQATFTVGAGKVPSAQTNFPALISGTYAAFATTANGGRISNTCNQTVGNNVTSVPCDLIFTSDAAGTQLLSWEFETYAAATGAVNIWVNVPSLASGTVIYAWYGQPSVTTLQTTPSATWPNYQAVYHMKENPAGTAPQLNDSTGNGNNATMEGPVTASQQQAGEIDGSINFEGNTYASLASSSTFSFERTDSFSVSGWLKIGANTTGALISKYPLPINAGWALMQYGGASSPLIALDLWGTNGATSAVAETPQVSMGVWHYVVATYSGTGTTAGMSIYIDGVNQTLGAEKNNLATSILNNDAPAINSRVVTASQESDDVMDEVRVSAKGVVLTPAWVTASYNNQSSPGTFFTVATGLTNP